MKSRITAAAVFFSAPVLVLLAAGGAAQRFLPGLLEELPGARVQVRRPLGFERDLNAPRKANLVERLKGTDYYRGRYRGWYVSLRHHAGFATEEAVHKSWEKYIRQEKTDWKHTLNPGLVFDGLPGLTAHAVPQSRRDKGGIFSGVVMTGGGRLIEIRVDVLGHVKPETGIHFVEDFLKFADLAPDQPGPRRILVDASISLRFPRHWIVTTGDAPLLISARHPGGKAHGFLALKQVRTPGTSESILAKAMGVAEVASGPQAIPFLETGTAHMAVTAAGKVMAAARLKDVAILMEGTGKDAAFLDSLVADTFHEMKPVDPAAETVRAESLVQSLKRALKVGKEGESEAILCIEKLADLLDLPKAKAVVSITFNTGTSRVKEAMARVLGARADNLSTRELCKIARKLVRKNMPTALAAVYHAMGRTAFPAAIPLLEAGLKHKHPVCVLAAVEGLGASFARPHKTFNTLLAFWLRLEEWARQRPQLKNEVAYPLLVRTVRSHLHALSDQTFEDPSAAQIWYKANRRMVGKGDQG